MIEPFTTRNGFTIRQLDMSDLETIDDVLASQRNSGGDGAGHFMRGAFISMLESPCDVILGAFEGGDLHSTLGWEVLRCAPYWITNAMTVNGNLYRGIFDPERVGLCDLIHTYYTESERQGVLRHFSARNARKLDLEMRMWDKRSDVFLPRYLRHDEAYVRAGELPSGFLHRMVMNFTPHPYDVIIRSVVLSPDCYDIRTGRIDPYPVDIRS